MSRQCGSGCPYYGVDEDYNGYCKIDGNSYRERFSPCNMGYGDSSDGSSSSSSSSSSSAGESGCGCLKWLIIIAVVLGLIGGVVSLLTRGSMASKEPALSQSEQQVVMYTTAEINLRESPSLNGAKIMVLPEDASVTVEKTEGEWSYVKYQDTNGWCKSEFLEKR